MKKGPGKNKINNLIFHKASLTVIGLVLIVAISVPLARNLSKQYEVNQEIEQLEKEINRLDRKNKELKNLIDYLETDQFVDRQAREGLNFKKPGEEVVVIKDQDKLGSATGSAGNDLPQVYDLPEASSQPQKTTNPERWWRYFFASS